MAYKLKWTPDALEDLADIGEHISKDDPAAFYEVGVQLLEAVNSPVS